MAARSFVAVQHRRRRHAFVCAAKQTFAPNRSRLLNWRRHRIGSGWRQLVVADCSVCATCVAGGRLLGWRRLRCRNSTTAKQEKATMKRIKFLIVFGRRTLCCRTTRVAPYTQITAVAHCNNTAQIRIRFHLFDCLCLSICGELLPHHTLPHFVAFLKVFVGRVVRRQMRQRWHKIQIRSAFLITIRVNFAVVNQRRQLAQSTAVRLHDDIHKTRMCLK